MKWVDGQLEGVGVASGACVSAEQQHPLSFVPIGCIGAYLRGLAVNNR